MTGGAARLALGTGSEVAAGYTGCVVVVVVQMKPVTLVTPVCTEPYSFYCNTSH